MPNLLTFNPFGVVLLSQSLPRVPTNIGRGAIHIELPLAVLPTGATG